MLQDNSIDNVMLVHAPRHFDSYLISGLSFLNILVLDLHGLDLLDQICRMPLDMNRLADLEGLGKIEHSHADAPKIMSHLADGLLFYNVTSSAHIL